MYVPNVEEMPEMYCSLANSCSYNHMSSNVESKCVKTKANLFYVTLYSH